jgi:hypothetical protein
MRHHSIGVTTLVALMAAHRATTRRRDDATAAAAPLALQDAYDEISLYLAGEGGGGGAPVAAQDARRPARGLVLIGTRSGRA